MSTNSDEKAVQELNDENTGKYYIEMTNFQKNHFWSYKLIRHGVKKKIVKSEKKHLLAKF